MAGKPIKVPELTYNQAGEIREKNPETYQSLSNVVQVAVDNLYNGPQLLPEKETDDTPSQEADYWREQYEKLLDQKPETITETVDNPELLQKLADTEEALKLQKQINTELAKREPEKVSGSGNISEEIPKSLMPFLTEVANRETNRVGHQVTPVQVLCNLFWAQISKGAGDHLPITYSQSEIKKVLENVKKEMQNGHE